MLAKFRRGKRLTAIIICALLIITVYSIGSYYSSTVSRSSLPSGGAQIWAGPYPRANVTGTWLAVSVVNDSIILDVFFAPPLNESMYFYAILPFASTGNNSYVIQSGPLNESWGHKQSSYHVSPVNHATIVNENFTPKPYSLVSNEPLDLRVALYGVQQLVTRNDGATDTVILPFFGASLLESDMEPYLVRNTQPVWNSQILVTVQFPTSDTLSTDTFPTPVAYYATSGYQSVSFPVTFFPAKFANGESLAQTVYCSFTDPLMQQNIQRSVFLSGVTIGITVPLIIELSKSYIRKPTSESQPA